MRGFTLLEVLVSLAILAVVYGVILQIIGGSARQAARAGDYRSALLIAESQLELAAAARDIDALPRQGTAAGKYDWAIDFEPTSAYEPVGIRSLYTPVITRVRVEWGDTHSARHRIELATVRLQGMLR
ncbi:MAG: type II secretion system GspH family protein [Gammaproteobacteria bacterium]|nr:type II secretion system GspH family protein [Gammaproteobacteria bacterium]